MTATPGDPRAVIPHRPPILCIDRIVSAGGDRAAAEGDVGDGPLVAAGELWEGAIIEGMAQTAAVLLDRKLGEEGLRPRKGVLAGIRGLLIERRPRRGETVRYDVEIIRVIFPLSLVRCEARSGGELLASGEMKFFVETGS